jgi:exosortase/archaeosortase family protein
MVTKLPPYLQFLIRFLTLYAILYYGTYAFIGASTKGGIYISWLKYIDYVSFYRKMLLASSAIIVEWFGYYTYLRSPFVLSINGNGGVQLIYWCLGIGVISFWISYILANSKDSLKKRFFWLFGGTIVITLLNIIRIAFLLIATQAKTATILSINHHDLYTGILYVIILLMVYLHYRKTN